MIELEYISEPGTWRDALRRLPAECQDVYFTAEYHALHRVRDEAEAECMALSDGRHTLVVPGMRTIVPADATVDGPLWDLQTCNGYGGPLASAGCPAEFIQAAWARWRVEAAQRGCVAAFFRLHPLLDNVRWLPADAVVRRERTTVFVDLTGGVEVQLRAADSRHRNMVNKGAREQVRIDWDVSGGWEEFEGLYATAMERLNAPASLRFSRDYFTGLRRLPGARLTSVMGDGRLVAAACFMSGPVWGHYHLSARRPESENHLTNCMLQSMFEQAAATGRRGVHLGGGRTPASDDDLLKFKLRTGGRPREFAVALVITNPPAYARLCGRWSELTGKPATWLLGYRQPREARVN